MLISLQIENYALIDHLEFNPVKGLTVITGETGAGKSIIMGALSLILAERLNVDPKSDHDHIFLMFDNIVYLDRFNCLETAALFVDLEVYDATFLSLRDDRVAEYLKSLGYVTEEQIDELQSALNPLFCNELIPKQDCLA